MGRLRSGPERELVADYLARFDRTGRALGLGPAEVVEIEDRSGGGRSGEAAALARVLPAGAAIWALDERGEMLSSPGLAAALARLRDEARPLALLIGGADGLDPGLRDRADRVLSLGPMVWPHMLVRVMLAEQLYRSTTILAGTPYHRA